MLPAGRHRSASRCRLRVSPRPSRPRLFNSKVTIRGGRRLNCQATYLPTYLLFHPFVVKYLYSAKRTSVVTRGHSSRRSHVFNVNRVFGCSFFGPRSLGLFMSFRSSLSNLLPFKISLMSSSVGEERKMSLEKMRSRWKRSERENAPHRVWRKRSP